MRIININGPINSGKTTVSKLLQEKLPDCLFVEVDELLSDEEQKELNLSREKGWVERLKRLNEIITQEQKIQRYENIIFAYPMTGKTYHQWKLWKDENTEFINITLAPKLNICLQNRGTRELNEAEKERIKQMYKEGYNCPEFADLIIDNSTQTPTETLQKVLEFLSFNIHRAKSEDAAAIKKIHIETYQTSYRGYIPDEYLDNMLLDDEVIKRTKEYLNTTECWVAVYNEKPVGFAYVSYPEEDAFEINALYVHPKHQKCGIGSKLIDFLCTDKNERGLVKCIVWTMKFGPSLPFYKKIGFVPTNDEKMWKFEIPIIKLEKNL